MLNLSPLAQMSRRLFVAGLCLSLLACSPVMREQKVPGSFAWFELVTESPDVARDFYSSLFGWQFSDGPTDQTRLISSGGRFVGGLVSVQGQRPRAEAEWQPVLSVADTMRSVQVAKSAGGRLAERPVRTIDGTYAVITDNSHASVTLYDGPAGIPNQAAKPNTWIWVDLLTNRTSAAKRFYKSVAGFDTRRVTSGGSDFTVFQSEGRDRGGLVRVSRSQIEPNWLPYVLVTDLDSTISRAKSLGAAVLAKEDGSAILLDPAGAAIGVTTRKGRPQ